MKLKQLIIEHNVSFGHLLIDERFCKSSEVADWSQKLWLTEAAIMKVIKDFQGLVSAVVLE